MFRPGVKSKPLALLSTIGELWSSTPISYPSTFRRPTQHSCNSEDRGAKRSPSYGEVQVITSRSSYSSASIYWHAGMGRAHGPTIFPMPQRIWPVLATKVAAPVLVFKVYNVPLYRAAYKSPLAYTIESTYRSPVFPIGVAAPVLRLKEYKIDPPPVSSAR